MDYTNSVQNEHWRHLSESLLHRLKNEKYTDCTFIIGSQKAEFRLTRFVISLISPVFEAMLYGKMRESENNSTIIINDIDVDAFQCVVSFAYGNDPNITLNNVASLLSLCDKYQILPLLEIANNYFQSSLNAKTFCVLFNQSINIKSTFCMNLCIEYLKQMYLKFNRSSHSDIIQTSYILNVDAMEILLQSDYLLLKEEKIWEAYLRWLSYQSQQQPHCENEREQSPQSLDSDEVVSRATKCISKTNKFATCKYTENGSRFMDTHKLYKYIRFGLIDSVYFIKSVVPTKVLSDSEMVTIMKYSICNDEGCGEFNVARRGRDIWSDDIGDDMEIVEETNTLIHKATVRSSQTALLAMEFAEGIHKWRFKIAQLQQHIGDGSDWTSSIGIYKLDDGEHEQHDEEQNDTKRMHRDVPTNNHFMWDNHRITGYAFCPHSGQLKVYDEVNDFCVSSNYGVECKNGDVIEMHADMDKLQLKYIINEVDYGQAFCIQQAKYRAAVNLDIPHDAVQLL